MAKVTSKLQVTIPKRIADRYGIKPGDDIEFQESGRVIRVVPPQAPMSSRLSVEERVRLFDQATARQREREASMAIPAEAPADRGWTREDLYDRDKTR